MVSASDKDERSAHDRSAQRNMAADLVLVVAFSLPILFAIFAFATVEAGGAMIVAVSFFELAVTLSVIAKRGFRWQALAGIPGWATALCIGVIAVASGTAVFVSANPLISLVASAFSLLHVIYGLVLMSSMTISAEPSQRALALAFGLAMVAYLPLMILYFLIAGTPADGIWTDALPGFGNVRRLGAPLAAGAGAILGLMAFTPREQPRRYYGLAAAAIVLWGMLFWTGSRGAVCALVGAVLVTSFILPAATRMRFLRISFMTLFLGAALSFVHTPPDPNFGLFNAAERVAGDEPTGRRLDIWRDTAEAILQRPWFGHGAAQLREAVGDRPYEAIHPHNMVLQVLLDWGLVGGGAFLVLVGVMWIRAYASAWRGSGANLPLFLPLTALLALSLLDGVFFYPYPLLIVTTLFAAIFARHAEHYRS